MQNQPVNSSQDEISLIDIVTIIINGKCLLAGVALLTTLIAIVYAFMATPYYEAKAFVASPTQKDVQILLSNDLFEDNSNLSTNQIYSEFLDALNLRKNLKEFYNLNNLYEGYVGELGLDEGKPIEIFEEHFVSKLKVSLPKLKDSSEKIKQVQLSFEYYEPEQAAELLNKYISYVSSNYKQKIVDTFVSERDDQVNKLNLDIESKRASYKVRINDRITELEESGRIAESLGISNFGESMGKSQHASGVDVLLSTDETPLYMRGTKAISAELSALKARKDFDPFINGLRDLQERVINLKQKELTVNDFKVVSVEQLAVGPADKVKPKKAIIILGGLVFGLFLGLFIVFIAAAYKSVQHSLIESKPV